MGQVNDVGSVTLEFLTFPHGHKTIIDARHSAYIPRQGEKGRETLSSVSHLETRCGAPCRLPLVLLIKTAPWTSLAPRGD